MAKVRREPLDLAKNDKKFKPPSDASPSSSVKPFIEHFKNASPPNMYNGKSVVRHGIESCTPIIFVM